MEIDHERCANASEWLDDVLLANVAEASPGLWRSERARGAGPLWTDCDGMPSYRRAAIETGLNARSIAETGQRGCM